MHQDPPETGWVLFRALSGPYDAPDMPKHTRLFFLLQLPVMLAGDFYASSGVVLDDVDFRDNHLTIRIRRDGNATFTTRSIGTRNCAESSGEIGVVLAEATGREPTYVVRSDELYMRAVVTSSKPCGFPSMSTRGSRPGFSLSSRDCLAQRAADSSCRFLICRATSASRWWAGSQA